MAHRDYVPLEQQTIESLREIKETLVVGLAGIREMLSVGLKIWLCDRCGTWVPHGVHVCDRHEKQAGAV